eukprot:scaffold8416_cov267-Pinguiococcus_pyrenoidosus.AAC.5
MLAEAVENDVPLHIIHAAQGAAGSQVQEIIVQEALELLGEGRNHLVRPVLLRLGSLAEPEIQIVHQGSAVRLHDRAEVVLADAPEGPLDDGLERAREHLHQKLRPCYAARAASEAQPQVAQIDSPSVQLHLDVHAAHLSQIQRVQPSREFWDGPCPKSASRVAHLSVEAFSTVPTKAGQGVGRQRDRVLHDQLRAQKLVQRTLLRRGARPHRLGTVSQRGLRRPASRRVQEPEAPVRPQMALNVAGRVQLLVLALVLRQIQAKRHLRHLLGELFIGVLHGDATVVAAVHERVVAHGCDGLGEDAHAHEVHHAGEGHEDAEILRVAQVPVQAAELVAGELAGGLVVAAEEPPIVHGELEQDVLAHILLAARKAPHGLVGPERLLAQRQVVLADDDPRVDLGLAGEVARERRHGLELHQQLLFVAARQLERLPKAPAPVRATARQRQRLSARRCRSCRTRRAAGRARAAGQLPEQVPLVHALIGAWGGAGERHRWIARVGRALQRIPEEKLVILFHVYRMSANLRGKRGGAAAFRVRAYACVGLGTKRFAEGETQEDSKGRGAHGVMDSSVRGARSCRVSESRSLSHVPPLCRANLDPIFAHSLLSPNEASAWPAVFLAASILRPSKAGEITRSALGPAFALVSRAFGRPLRHPKPPFAQPRGSAMARLSLVVLALLLAGAAAKSSSWAQMQPRSSAMEKAQKRPLPQVDARGGAAVAKKSSQQGLPQAVKLMIGAGGIYAVRRASAAALLKMPESFNFLGLHVLRAADGGCVRLPRCGGREVHAGVVSADAGGPRQRGGRRHWLED